MLLGPAPGLTGQLWSRRTRVLLLPLEPRSEIPTRADLSSVVYRRWLKEKGLRYGTAEGAGVSA